MDYGAMDAVASVAQLADIGSLWKPAAYLWT